MEENKKRFILYEYLLYFWKKKYYFIMIPLLTAVLCVGIVYLLKYDGDYKVTATVFTGSVNTKELTDPQQLEFQYKEVNPSLKVSVPRNDYLQFTLTGKDKKQLNEDIETITNDSYRKLDDKSTDLINKSSVIIEKADKHAESLEVTIEKYKDDLLSFEGTSYEYEELAELISEQESIYFYSLELAHEKRNKLAFHEEPRKLDIEFQQSKTYWKESIIVGILIGLVLTVGLLMLMKYIEEARRNYRHD
jgi:hypothetical protein